jgi:hypothetical protein
LYQIYWWRKPEYPEKTTGLPQVTDKLLSHNVVSEMYGCVILFSLNNRCEGLLGCLSKFEILLLSTKAIVLVPEMYDCKVLFERKK